MANTQKKEIAYKVVKRKRNGARVSVVVPDWHPCYTVYQRNGENVEAPSGFVFNNLLEAKEWMRGQFNWEHPTSCNIVPGEKLELWKVKCNILYGSNYMYSTNVFLCKQKFSNFRKMRENIRKLKFYSEIARFIQDKIIGWRPSASLIKYAHIAENIELVEKVAETEEYSGEERVLR